MGFLQVSHHISRGEQLRDVIFIRLVNDCKYLFMLLKYVCFMSCWISSYELLHPYLFVKIAILFNRCLIKLCHDLSAV
jgi:hypothetical protein